jgi:RNA-directed DNA polymerase
MSVHGELWMKVIAWDNLLAAYRAASKGKRYRPAALRFSAQLEENLINIQNHLIWYSWQPDTPREFRVVDPKSRLIQAPPFGDRVVHHALVNVIEPLFERRFIHDSYACRRGKGVHAAIRRLQYFLRVARRRWVAVYVLQMDISKYFASISHDRLMAILNRTIPDVDALWLCDTIIRAGGDKGVGIPVGALTSQLFANAYLDRLDHFVKDELGERYYVRYMDDFVILGPDSGSLRALRRHIERWLWCELELRVNPKSNVYPVKCGVDFCGYRTWATHILPRKRNVKRARKALRGLRERFDRGEIELCDVRQRMASFLGYLRHCQSWRVLQSMKDDWLSA